MRAEVKYFSERNPLIIGAVGTSLVVGACVAALEYQNVPFINSKTTYAAYFQEAGGLMSGASVQVSGMDVGKVDSIDLDGARVLITFSIDKDIEIGDRTEAAIKTKSLLGAKILDVSPRGDGVQSGVIPIDRTRSPYQLPDALGDLAATISGLDTGQVSRSLQTLSETFRDTPPALKVAVGGVARLSRTLNQRDEKLRDLLANAHRVTGVLAKRSDQIVSLVADANALLVQLQSQSGALDDIASNISAVSHQLKAFIAENGQSLKPAVDHLNGVLKIIDNRKERVQKSLKLLNAYAMSLGESVSSGPFFKAYLVNLLPGQFIQPFVDAAFSDLGLDPNVLLPSQRTDPQVGQRATPPLPMPYPRTGQGGQPNLTLPDAITGRSGDPRYPYREPLPAPPPGGPPPGPPAPEQPGKSSTPAPASSPVFEPAPGEPGYAPAPTGQIPRPSEPRR